MEPLEQRRLLAASWSENRGAVSLNTNDNTQDIVCVSALPGGRLQITVDGACYQSRSAVTKATIRTNGGDDQVTASDAVLAQLVIYGGKGNDVIIGGGACDTLYGEDGCDLIRGGAGDDLIYGGNHNDKLFGDAGKDKLYGQGGNDEIWGGPGADYMDGACFATDIYHGWFRADGVHSVDTYKMDNQYPRIKDILLPDETDLCLPSGWSWCQSNGALVVDMATGCNVNLQVLTGNSVRVCWSGTSWDFCGLTSLTVYGTNGPDNICLAGLNIPVWVDGRAGDDVLTGGNANDTLIGGPGCDIVIGGPGADVLNVQDGVIGNDQTPDFNPTCDTLVTDVPLMPALPPNWCFTGGQLTVDMNTATGVGITIVNGNTVHVVWNGVCSWDFGPLSYLTVIGTPGPDCINLTGLCVNATIDGLAGDDVLTGGSGNDTIIGGLGCDTLNGGPGCNTLDARDGVAQNDRLYFAAVDTVLRDACLADVPFVDSINPFTNACYYSGETVELRRVADPSGIWYSLWLDGCLRVPDPRKATAKITVVVRSLNCFTIDPQLQAELLACNLLDVQVAVPDPNFG
jgi:Ca2+-binding RTX toxin-like protein